MIGDFVPVFNRAPHPITITKDGRQYVLPPGKGHLRSDLIPLGKNQNPVPGTEDPGSTITASFLSVVAANKKDQVDPLDPITAEELAALPKERLNRNLLPPDRQVNVSEVHRADFPTGRVGVDQPTAGMHEAGQRFN